jgi:hypothetical protein
MKCEIIQDLLTLYVDELTSEESNKLIDEHVAQCETCKKMKDNMMVSIEINNLNMDMEEKLMRKIQNNWTKKILFGIFFGAALTFYLYVATMNIHSYLINNLSDFRYIGWLIFGCLGYVWFGSIKVQTIITIIFTILIGLIEQTPLLWLLTAAAAVFTLSGGALGVLYEVWKEKNKKEKGEIK